MKKLRKEIEFKGHGGLFDAFDDMLKEKYNITDEEYDYIAMTATDEELSIFLNGLGSLGSTPSFTTKRKSLEIRNKYLNLFNKQT